MTQSSSTAPRAIPPRLSEGALSALADELRSALPGCGSILLCGSALRRSDPGDLDLVAVMDEPFDPLAAMRAIAPTLSRRSVDLGLLVTCFPVSAASLRSGTTQFLRNVAADGRRL